VSAGRRPQGKRATPAPEPAATGAKLSVDAIRGCLEGAIPAQMATAAPDGTPNVAYLSQVQYVDADHVALSFQFFNKTRQNVLANPRATLLLVDPQTAALFRLHVEYLRTETTGPLFEAMKAKLAGIASHSGMAGVFRLLGSDVYRVHAIEAVPGEPLPAPPPRCSLLPALRRSAERIARCRDLDGLLQEALDCLQQAFAVEHAMVLMADAPGARLYTVASRGYPDSGVGSEIPFDCGVIGMAARQMTPIRISHLTAEYAYARSIRESAARGGLAAMLETEIPLPGLAEPHSQLAVPIVGAGRLVGVLFVESARELRFTYDDEDALVTLAGQIGAAMPGLQAAAEAPGEEPAPGAGGQRDRAIPSGGAPVTVRHFAADNSVFLDDDYLIKGVAGAIFWALVRDHVDAGRSAFTNRELRLDPRIRLPDVSDNLEARLILLERRLVERQAAVRIEKTGRGRFHLRVDRPLHLLDVPAGTAR
jgi:adenylate cyclase